MRDASEAPNPVKAVQEGVMGGGGTLVLALTGFGRLAFSRTGGALMSVNFRLLKQTFVPLRMQALLIQET